MNKIIVITGASSGIGKEIATYFSNLGDQVIGVSRSVPKNVSFDYYACDLQNHHAIEDFAAAIESKYQKIDCLINCAGMGISGAIEYTNYEEVVNIFSVNVFGLYYMSKVMIPLLRKGTMKKIINIGSVAGDLTIPFQTFYTMTKASVHTFSEGLRMELLPFGIDVSCVLPGDTKTEFTRNRKPPILDHSSIYEGRIERSIQKMEKDEQNGKSPLTVVYVVKKLLSKKKMPAKVTVGFEYKVLVFLKRLLPKKLELSILYQMYGK